MISLQDVTKQYPDGTVAVHDLNLEVDEGLICALVGPSGCGKTTTMRMINRLIEPTGGTIQVDGEDVTALDVQELRRRIGYVIQNAGLFPHYTVRRNVATVCRLLGWDKAKIADRVDEMLDLVDLDPDTFGDRYPHQLSGGQRQRVGVARALAADPPGACSWTNHSARSTRSPASGCRTSSSRCTPGCARPWSWSPMTSTRPSNSATGSR